MAMKGRIREYERIKILEGKIEKATNVDLESMYFRRKNSLNVRLKCPEGK